MIIPFFQENLENDDEDNDKSEETRFDEEFDIYSDLGNVNRTTIERFAKFEILEDEEKVNYFSMLNEDQRRYMLEFMRKLKIYDECESQKIKPTPIFEFVGGSAGTGKSVLIKALVQAVVSYYKSKPGANPDRVTVVVCAPTGKAAFIIGGVTIHHAFGLPFNQTGNRMSELSHSVANSLK